MSIGAVVAYLASLTGPDGKAREGSGPHSPPHSNTDELDATVRQAASAGYAFDADELRRVLDARDLLTRVREDEALCGRLLEAERPRRALIEEARRLGSQADEPALAALLGPVQGGKELDDRALEKVAGGASFFLPELDDEVLIGFARGEVRAPVVIGALWNGKDKPPS